MRIATIRFFCLVLSMSAVFVVSGSSKTVAKTTSTPRIDAPQMVIQAGHSRSIHDFVFNPSGDLFITGDLGGMIGIWDIKANALKRVISSHDPVYALAIHPKGSLLAAGLESGAIEIRDINAGKVVKKILAYKNPVDTMAFLKDGIHLAALGSDEEGAGAVLRVWNIKTGKRKININTKASSSEDATLSKDGSLVVAKEYKRIPNAAYYYEILLIDVMTGKTLKRFKSNDEIGYSRMALSHDNKMIATEYRKYNGRNVEYDIIGLILMNARTGVEIAKIPLDAKFLRCLEFSPDGKTLVANSDRELFAIETHKAKSIIKKYEIYNQMKNLFSPDGTTIAMVVFGSIKLYNAEKMEKLDRLDFQSPLYLSHREIHRGDFLSAYEQRQSGEKYENVIYEWNLRTGVARAIQKDYLNMFYKDNEPYRMLRENGVKVGIDKTGMLVLIDANTDKRAKTLLEGRYILGTAFGMNDSLIASWHCIDQDKACIDEKLTVWSAQTGEVLNDIPMKSNPAAALPSMRTMEFIPNTRKLMTMDYVSQKSYVWNLNDNSLMFEMEGVPKDYCHFFSPDQKYLFFHNKCIVAGNFLSGRLPQNEDYKIWNLETGKRTLDVIPEEKFDLKNESVRPLLSLSPDSKTLGVGWFFCGRIKQAIPAISCKMKMIEFVDVNTGKTVKKLEKNVDKIREFVYHPDGKHIIVTERDGIRYLNIETGKTTVRFEDQPYELRGTYPCCGGHVLISSRSDGSTVLLSEATGKTLATLRMFPSGEWLVTDPTGNFDCSGCDKKTPDGAMKYIKWRLGDKMYPADKYFDKYFKRGLLAKTIKNAS